MSFIFFIFFTVILLFSGPTIAQKDSGEIASTAFILGVPHATGFPVLMNLLKISSFLPVSEIALRMTLISIICAALVMVIMWLIMKKAAIGKTGFQPISCLTGKMPIDRRDACPPVLLTLGCLILVFCETFFLHASTIEVYVPSLLVSVILILLALKYRETQDLRLLAVNFFLTGLCFGLHVSAWYCSIFVLILIFIFSKDRKKEFYLFLKFLPLFFLGLSVIVYLPVSASRMPQRNWGNPQILERFLLHASGMNIVNMFREKIFETSTILDNFRTFIRFSFEPIMVLTPLLLIGVITVIRQAFFLILILGIILIDLFFAIKINPMGISELQTGILFMFGFSIFSGIGAFASYNFVKQRSSKLRFFVIVCIFILFIPVVSSFIHTSIRANNYFPHDMTEAFINEVPEESLVLTQSDDMNSIIIFQKIVEHQRPDILHAVKQHLSDKHYIDILLKYNDGKFFSKKFRELTMKLPTLGSGIESNKAILSELISYNVPNRNVFYEIGEAALDKDYYANLSPHFPVFKIDSQYDLIMIDTYLRKADVWKEKTDKLGKLFLSEIVTNMGIFLNFKGFTNYSMFAFKKAIEISNENPRAYYNLGVIALNKGWVEEGLSRIKHSLELLPNYKKAQETLNKYENK